MLEEKVIEFFRSWDTKGLPKQKQKFRSPKERYMINLAT